MFVLLQYVEYVHHNEGIRHMNHIPDISTQKSNKVSEKNKCYSLNNSVLDVTEVLTETN